MYICICCGLLHSRLFRNIALREFYTFADNSNNFNTLADTPHMSHKLVDNFETLMSLLQESRHVTNQLHILLTRFKKPNTLLDKLDKSVKLLHLL